MGRHPILVAVNLTLSEMVLRLKFLGLADGEYPSWSHTCFVFFCYKRRYIVLIRLHNSYIVYRYLLGERKVILTSKMGIINLCTLTYEVRIPLRRPSSLVIFGKMTCSFCCLFLSEGTIMALHVQYRPEYPLGQHMPTILSWGMGSSHSKSPIPSETRNVLFRCLGS